MVSFHWRKLVYFILPFTVGTEATLLNILGAISEGNLYLKNIAQEQKFDLQDIVTMKNISDAGLARQYFKIGDQVIVP